MAHFNLGRTLEELGQNIEAAKSYQHALELNEIEAELDSDEINQRLYGLFEV